MSSQILINIANQYGIDLNKVNVVLLSNYNNPECWGFTVPPDPRAKHSKWKSKWTWMMFCKKMDHLGYGKEQYHDLKKDILALRVWNPTVVLFRHDSAEELRRTFLHEVVHTMDMLDFLEMGWNPGEDDPPEDFHSTKRFLYYERIWRF